MGLEAWKGNRWEGTEEAAQAACVGKCGSLLPVVPMPSLTAGPMGTVLADCLSMSPSPALHMGADPAHQQEYQMRPVTVGTPVSSLTVSQTPSLPGQRGKDLSFYPGAEGRLRAGQAGVHRIVSLIYFCTRGDL